MTIVNPSNLRKKARKSSLRILVSQFKMAAPNPVNFNFLNAFAFGNGMANAIIAMIVQNYSTRPKFTPGEVKIFRANEADDGVASMVRRGTKILDAYFFHHYGQTEAIRPAFAVAIVPNELPDVNLMEQVDAMTMWFVTVMTRGEISPDDGMVPLFARKKLDKPTMKNSELCALITTAVNIKSFIPTTLVCGDLRNLDRAVKSKLDQGFAGHKAVKLAAHALPMFEQAGINSEVLNAMEWLVGRHWRFLHSTISDGAIHSLIPKFTHTVIAQLCKDAPALADTLLKQQEITTEDRNAILAMIGRSTPGIPLVNEDQVHDLVLKCFSYGEFILEAGRVPKTIPAAFRAQVRQDRIVREDAYGNHKYWMAHDEPVAVPDAEAGANAHLAN